MSSFSLALVAAALLCATANTVSALPVAVEVAPAQTGRGIIEANGAHRLTSDDEATSNGLLMVSLGGTNSLPVDFSAFGDEAARLGYQSIALDYPNSVISTAAAESDDPLAFRHFRQEIVSGQPVSDLVAVDAQNSIEARLTSLLLSLGPKWEAQFLLDGKPRWEKIVVVGHSQGAGHAAYLGKQHPLKAVLLLAGPQDSTSDGPAEWLFDQSKTPPSRYYALLHKADSFDSRKQMAAVLALRQGSRGTLGKEIIVLDTPVEDPHMSVIGPAFLSHWRQLLELASQGASPASP